MTRGRRGRALPAVVLALLAAPARGEEGWRVLVQGGQATAAKSAHFTEFAGVALARDRMFSRHFGGTAELYPLLQFNETRADASERIRAGASALALSLVYEIGPPGGAWGARIEAGSGVFWGWRRVPDQGSQFNFLDQGGITFVHRFDLGRLSAGWRRVHISNLGLAGEHNPGLSFHSLVLAWSPPVPGEARPPAAE